MTMRALKASVKMTSPSLWRLLQMASFWHWKLTAIKFFAASSVPSDSKDGSFKLVIHSVEEILGSGPLDVRSTFRLWQNTKLIICNSSLQQ
ncbi:hypothetical protein P692DRAFT_20475698 [Suillus brevipes Sb2]|nr:hypothetical protein P692DRAFT_20475698 [Suillus brevipes Sb2]